MSTVIEHHGRYIHQFSRQEADRLRRLGCVTENRIVFHDELSGSDGAWFCLICEPCHTVEDIAQAKREIRRNRDATGIDIGVLEPEDLAGEAT